MTPATFKSLLEKAEINQRDFHRMSGYAITTVNRWCSESAADRTMVPQNAVALVLAYIEMTPEQRALLWDKVSRLYPRKTD